MNGDMWTRGMQFIERVGIVGAIAAFLLWQIPQMREVIVRNTDVSSEAVTTLKSMNEQIKDQTLELRMHRHMSEPQGGPRSMHNEEE